MLGLDGISDFNALHSDKQNEEVQLCTFDILAIGADDLRNLPLIGESDHRMVTPDIKEIVPKLQPILAKPVSQIFLDGCTGV